MKKVMAAVLAGLMVLSMAACGAKDFDAKGYVQGVLDAQYHADYEKHAKDTGASEDEIKALMEGDQETMVDEMYSQIGVTPTDEEREEFLAMIREGYDKVEFEVQDAVKDDDGNYMVNVVVTPFGIMDGFEEIFSSKFTEALEAGEADETTFVSIMNESMRESLDQAKQLEPVTATLRVQLSADSDGNKKVYEIPQTDLDNLEMLAINQQ